MFKKSIVAILSGVLVLILVGCIYTRETATTTTDDGNTIDYTSSAVEKVSQTDSSISVDYSNITEIVASEVMPATVEITCTVYYSYTRQYMTGFHSTTSNTVTSSQTCAATGMVIDSDGYVLTNAHVVTIEDEDSYTNLQYTDWDIQLNYADQSVYYDAEVIGYDCDLDLAILLMDISNLENVPYVTFFNLTDPDSDNYNEDDAIKLNYGEMAIAIGNANGYGISVTTGVVSAPLRKFQNSNVITKAIQTDAAINSGNSGGPLCNKYGAVIGINSFKIVTSTSENLGYAIPSYVIIDFINDVAENSAQNMISYNHSITYYVTSERAYLS